MKKQLVAIVLDRSGSMQSILDETISGTNKQFEELKQDVGVETLVSLVSFNGEVKEHFWNQSPDKLEPLTKKTYKPEGWTALFDAVGRVVDKLEPMTACPVCSRDTNVLVVVISDGNENASRKYSSWSLSPRVKRLQESGWTFVYLGCNHDVFAQGQALGTTSTITWNVDETGKMYNNLSNALRTYRTTVANCGRADGETFTTAYNANNG